MKRLICCVVLIVLGSYELPAQQPAQAPVEPSRQVSAALEILNAWNADQAEPTPRYLHLVCWTPSDREFPAEYQTRLTRIMKHIQDFYAKEMQRHGLGRRSIQLQSVSDKEDSLLKLHTVTGLQPTAHYNVQSGGEIRKECLPVLKKVGIDAEKETVLIICNLAKWDPEKRVFSHKSPYYAGGSYRSGTGWQLDSPELDTLNLKKQQPMIRDGQYGRISLGKHNSIFIGGIAHELGHAIGLPHCAARPDEKIYGTALMGSGNRTYGDELRGEGRGSFLTLAHALRLASHPQFSGSTKGMNQRSQAEIDDLSITTQGKAIQITGTVSGSPPVYAVVAYFDPAGGGDYNATTATAVPDEEGKFLISSEALTAGKSGELRLFPLHVNGSAAGQMSRTRFRFPYQVAADGTPDLSTMEAKKELQSFLEALRNGNRKQASIAAGEIKSTLGKTAGQQFAAPQTPHQNACRVCR